MNKRKKSIKLKITYFLTIGVLVSSIFYILKISNVIDNLLSLQRPQNGNSLPGFTSRPTPPGSEPNQNDFVEIRTNLTHTLAPIPLPSSKPAILFNVPFTPQAPFGDWADPRQQNACEESSAIMAMRWVNGEALTLQEAEQEIKAISDYELREFGHFHDTSAEDVVERIFNGYFKYNNVELRSGINSDDIKRELQKGNLVLVPVNGQKLNNPFYIPPGPLEHMLVIKGYDNDTREFITNDPGTKRGDNFRYSEDIIEAALQDYPSGFHEPITVINKVMIIVKPRS